MPLWRVGVRCHPALDPTTDPYHQERPVEETTESTLAATSAAAEAVRVANNAAYHAPTGDRDNVYDRAGAAHDLLARTEQLLDDLRAHAQRLTETPGLTTADDTDPTARVRSAAAQLLMARARVANATQHVNQAWSELSPLYVAEGQDGDR
jgi:hypothetical protein